MQKRAERKAARGGRALFDGSGTLRPVRAHDARLLRHAFRSRANATMPRR